MPELQLQDPLLWVKVYDNQRQGLVISANSYIPIPSVIVPHIFTAHTLLIATDSQEALSRWRLGVRVQMMIDVPGSDFVQLPATQIAIPINRGLLVQFPILSTAYKLNIEVPEWHRSIRVTIWEHTGIE